MARRGGGNAGSIAAGEVEWAGRRTVLDACSLDAVARARRRCLRALLAFFAGGVIRQLRQRLPRPRRHDPHVITGCTCAQRTRHDERDAPPTRRGKDLYVCAPGSSGGVRRTLCWGRARAGSRAPRAASILIPRLIQDGCSGASSRRPCQGWWRRGLGRSRTNSSTNTVVADVID